MVNPVDVQGGERGDKQGRDSRQGDARGGRLPRLRSQPFLQGTGAEAPRASCPPTHPPHPPRFEVPVASRWPQAQRCSVSAPAGGMEGCQPGERRLGVSLIQGATAGGGGVGGEGSKAGSRGRYEGLVTEAGTTHLDTALGGTCILYPACTRPCCGARSLPTCVERRPVSPSSQAACHPRRRRPGAGCCARQGSAVGGTRRWRAAVGTPARRMQLPPGITDIELSNVRDRGADTQAKRASLARQECIQTAPADGPRCWPHPASKTLHGKDCAGKHRRRTGKRVTLFSPGSCAACARATRQRMQAGEPPAMISSTRSRC